MSATLDDYAGAPELRGRVVYEPGWYLLEIPELPPIGMPEADVRPASRPHISVMKGEAPSRNQPDWGTAFAGEEVTVRYVPTVRGDNGLHLWVDCHSPRLCEMREHFGLVTLRREDGAYMVNFHMTIARRRRPTGRTLRAQLRLTPQSHIDVGTGMQHL